MTTPEENMALVEAHFADIDDQNADGIDEHLADDYTDDSNRFNLEHDDTSNADEVNLAMMLETLYPNHEHVIDHIEAWDDKVLVAFTMLVPEHTLTADGSATSLDEPAEMSGMSLFTIECGLIASAKTVTDLSELMAHLGFEFAPAMQ